MILKIYTLITGLLLLTSLSFAQTTIVDGDLVGGQTYTWTAENEYILDGYVYLEDGGVLNIEPGTVIRGKSSGVNGDATSALIIARGAKLNAIGTAEAPIIFTGEFDDLSTTLDFTALDNKQWGGIIIMGKAPIGEDGGEEAIEGISAENEPRVLYGGDDPADDSGILKYVSIRHGGNEIAADNEINGLTLGGVGNGTEIDYIEVFANKDDGIEVFGGNVNITHAAVSFQGDDALDIDESWDGYVQYIFTIQQNVSADIGDNAVEYDGSERTDLGPKTVGRIYNGTFIGSGVGLGNSNGLRLKSDGAAQFWNCVWTEIQGGVFRLQNTSIDRFIAGETVFANNIAFNYGSFEIDPDNAFEITDVENIDPELGGISHLPNNMLDPRPATNDSPLFDNVATPTEANVETPNYRGAFDDQLWIEGWTALDAYGYLGDLSQATSTADLGQNAAGVVLSTAIPNPATLDQARFNFSLPAASDVTVRVIDLNGRLMGTKNLGGIAAGNNTFDLNIRNLTNGFYIVAMQTEQGVVTQKMTVQR